LPGRRRRPSAGPTTAPPTRLPDRRHLLAWPTAAAGGGSETSEDHGTDWIGSERGLFLSFFFHREGEISGDGTTTFHRFGGTAWFRI
jgi:hypothetical protein